MVTNFDYLKNESKFSAFANVAISAEKIILADPDASILNSRRAMEFAVKWLYSVENSLQIPYQDNLHTLMNTEEFRQLVGPDLWKRMVISADVEIVWRIAIKNLAEVQRYSVLKICRFFRLHCILLWRTVSGTSI